MNWVQKNFKKIIYIAFLFPIILVAFVSISHVTKWYGISNPMSWSVYLSVAVEVAALSALSAIVAKMGKRAYLPFAIVTFIQFIGNIFFSYQYVDITTKSFKDWVELVTPLVTFFGIEPGDMIGNKRLVSVLAGGLLPLISLTFLGMLVRFEEEDKNEVSNNLINKSEDTQAIDSKDIISEVSRVRFTDDELENLESALKNKKPINQDEILIDKTEQVFPALSDEEVHDMFMDEYEHNYNIDEEDYDLMVSDESELQNNKLESADKINLNDVVIEGDEKESSDSFLNETYPDLVINEEELIGEDDIVEVNDDVKLDIQQSEVGDNVDNDNIESDNVKKKS